MKKVGIGGKAGVSSTLGAAQAKRMARMILRAIQANGTPKQKSIWTSPKVFQKLQTMTPEAAKAWHAKTSGTKVR